MQLTLVGSLHGLVEPAILIHLDFRILMFKECNAWGMLLKLVSLSLLYCYFIGERWVTVGD